MQTFLWTEHARVIQSIGCVTNWNYLSQWRLFLSYVCVSTAQVNNLVCYRHSHCNLFAKRTESERSRIAMNWNDLETFNQICDQGQFNPAGTHFSWLRNKDFGTIILLPEFSLLFQEIWLEKKEKSHLRKLFRTNSFGTSIKKIGKVKFCDLAPRPLRFAIPTRIYSKQCHFSLCKTRQKKSW